MDRSAFRRLVAEVSLGLVGVVAAAREVSRFARNSRDWQLGETEHREETLRVEVELLTSTAASMFHAPPLEWIGQRLRILDEVLARDTTRSALVLRDTLGPLTLRPIRLELAGPTTKPKPPCRS